MAILCKYHIEECDVDSGKYYCKKCGRELQDHEVMSIAPVAPTKESNEKSSTTTATTPNNTSSRKPEKTKKKVAFSKGTLVTCVSLFAFIYSVFELSHIKALFVIVGFAATIGFIAGLVMRGNEKDEQKRDLERDWERQYSNPEWRKQNPDKVAIIEQKRQREHAKRHGPAVIIKNLHAGSYDHGTAYRASGWSNFANSAGGWSIRYKISNIGARTIKYVKFTVAAYNAVGDKCVSRINHKSDTTCTFTGPLGAGYSTDWLLNENLWYDISMHHVAIEHIHVDFMDGTSQDIYKNGKVVNNGF